MNKNFVAIAAVVVVLIVGYFFFSSRQATAPVKIEVSEAPTEAQVQETTTPSTSETAVPSKKESVVTYTADGFSPKSLTVKSGTAVAFVNNSDSPMWVASNPHPTHTDLPGFDELAGAKKGETYSFTFVKKGTWKYHNHLSPSDFGAITVE